ncbi:MAG: 3'3'-cGAMP-specific phosphodiesterase 1 [Chlamydiae bacterium]|nr:3'3'-cGAMP-specific phosphodiesterase 1 [Chlamydiota bacterium]
MTTLLEKVTRLNEIGIALSAERNVPVLLEKILRNAKLLTNADGATIYTVLPDQKVRFEIIITGSLGYYHGGSSGEPITFSAIDLYLSDGVQNNRHMVAYAVNNKTSVKIDDAYVAEEFDFSGTREFDKATGYRTIAVLTIPIMNHEHEVIAAMQLINPIDSITQAVTTFTLEDLQLSESLASQAGVALANQQLMENQLALSNSLIRLFAEAIDEKSPAEGNHAKRVPIVSEMLAEAVNNTNDGPLKKIHFSDDQLYELMVAAFLHDCGKLITPSYIVEKKNKLETIIDCIELINTRIEVMKRDAKIALLEKKITPQVYEKEIQDLENNQKLIDRCNTCEEPITPEIEKLIDSLVFLTPDEKEAVLIPRGNLTKKEHVIIQHHVEITQRMLGQLVLPKNLEEVVEIASNHHEWVGGGGYPRGLIKEQLSLRARILAISDAFEALSAPDRPYKKRLPLPKIYEIMEKMVKEGHLDPDLFEVFQKQNVGQEYVKHYCAPD